ncbi:MAG: hypothetical protein A2104_05750 [Candidatus Melainabacteria bacterium GWF2_32_7]|nr:MAG: hypothetical protein A2104_05750 [Candidatus Melainabacteria bacterium GWF2_32_7]
MINFFSNINITPQKYKQTNSFCKNSKKADLPLQNTTQNPIQSLSAEHARANFYPIKNISFGNVLKPVFQEITPKDVIKRLNEQLNMITPEKIQEILNSFDESVRPLAAKLMQRLTQFGNMESLNEIAKHIKKNKGNFFDHDLVDTTTIMSYLNNRKFVFDIIYNKDTKYYYILDKVALEELKTNKNHLREIKNNPDVKIIYPEGWINGINPFNQTEHMREKIQKFIPGVQKLQAEKGLTTDKAITTVLNEEITKKIKELGLQEKFKIIRNPKARIINPTAEKISKQLAPVSMTEKDLKQVIDDLPSYSKQIMLDYLIKNADIYSPGRLSVCLKKMHDKFQRKGMLSEGTYYYVPDARKSYGMIAMMYKLVNNIPNNRFIYESTNIPLKAKRIIILDDIAGSGDQLNKHKDRLRVNFNKNITIAPVLSTSSAAKRFSKNTKNITFCPHRIKDGLVDSAYLKSLKGVEQQILLEELENLGFSDDGLSVVFPYMSPDNNNSFFAKNIAPKFTLNGAGVKNWQNNF